jgi:hypothetical protein
MGHCKEPKFVFAYFSSFHPYHLLIDSNWCDSPFKVGSRIKRPVRYFWLNLYGRKKISRNCPCPCHLRQKFKRLKGKTNFTHYSNFLSLSSFQICRYICRHLNLIFRCGSWCSVISTTHDLTLPWYWNTMHKLTWCCGMVRIIWRSIGYSTSSDAA